MRERQEVQVLPWRRLTPPRPSADEPRDFAAELAPSGTGSAEAERYLGRDKLEARRAELEAEVAKPDLWDDQDNARSVTRELAASPTTSSSSTGSGPPSTMPTPCLELTEESAAAGSRDATLDAELVETVDALVTRAQRAGAAVAVLG